MSISAKCRAAQVQTGETGGMSTKITAAAAATKSVGINTVVMAGDDPGKIYKLLEGEEIGTIFTAVEGTP